MTSLWVQWRLKSPVSRLFRRRPKKTSKLRVTGLCEGNSSVTGEFPAQRTRSAENVSIWWRHHGAVAFIWIHFKYEIILFILDIVTVCHTHCNRHMACRSWSTEYDSKNVIFNLVLLIGIFRSSHNNALRWMSRDLTDDKSRLVQAMAWCRQATSHYLSQCWLSSLPPYGVISPQWVKLRRVACAAPSHWVGQCCLEINLTPVELTSVKIELRYKWFLSRKYIWNCRL